MQPGPGQSAWLLPCGSPRSRPRRRRSWNRLPASVHPREPLTLCAPFPDGLSPPHHPLQFLYLELLADYVGLGTRQTLPPRVTFRRRLGLGLGLARQSDKQGPHQNRKKRERAQYAEHIEEHRIHQTSLRARRANKSAIRRAATAFCVSGERSG